jgi:hypothetical protein
MASVLYTGVENDGAYASMESSGYLVTSIPGSDIGRATSPPAGDLINFMLDAEKYDFVVIADYYGAGKHYALKVPFSKRTKTVLVFSDQLSKQDREYYRKRDIANFSTPEGVSSVLERLLQS